LKIYSFILLSVIVFNCKKKPVFQVKEERETGSTITIRDYERTSYDTEGKLKWKLFSKETYYFNEESKTIIYNVYVEQYEGSTIKAKVWADKGMILQAENLMKLEGNVKIITNDGKQFETEELTYNTDEQIIRSDKKVTIQLKRTIIRGIGFEADKNLNKYKILKPEAVSIGTNPLKDN